MAEMVVESGTQRKPIIAPFDNFLNEVLKKLAFSTLRKHTTRFLNINFGENPLPNLANGRLRNGRKTKSRVRLRAKKTRRHYIVSGKQARPIGRSSEKNRRSGKKLKTKKKKGIGRSPDRTEATD